MEWLHPFTSTRLQHFLFLVASTPQSLANQNPTLTLPWVMLLPFMLHYHPLHHHNNPAMKSHLIKDFPFSTLDPFGFFFHQDSLPCYQLISQCPDCSQLNSWDLAWSVPLKLIVFSMLYPPLQFLLHCTPTTFSILVNLYLYLLY